MWSKIKTVGRISDFVNNDSTLGAATPSFDALVDWALHPVSHTKELGIDLAYNKIEPFLEILRIVSYPIASLIIAIAGLLYILNLKERSISWLTKTSISYIIVQLLPLLTKALLQMLAV
ncbi:hypothetical protein [Priestia flexa]|uniref:hypothetical protein n=1 Tax=Priestia flexa TaxID=86664 RepID=UPI00249351CB|nr:hypothetical protein [Priestia flexa]